MNVCKKIGKTIWNNRRLIFIFIFSFLVYEFIAFPNNNGDPIAMYSFSHAIKTGEVPYRDFSIISTPLYAFLMSIGLFIFDNYLMFILEQCILVTVLFYFLFKMYDKKAWLILFGMCLIQFFGFIPTYNFLCLLFIVILVYVEKNYPDMDYLIGFLLGLAFFSKHTVGAFLVLTTCIIHFKELKKLFKRAVGFLIPCVILSIYLIATDSFYDFINLTILGLFDFGSNNSNFQGKFFWLSLLLLSLMLIIFLRSHKDKYKYTLYLLCGFVFCIPLFDTNHFGLFFNCFCIFLMNYIDFGIKINFCANLSIGITALFSVLYFICVNSFGGVFYKELNHFQYMYNFKSDYENDLKVNSFLNKYSNKNMVILSGYTMFFDITHDREINYFDVLLYGNHGYNGTKTLIKKIEEQENLYIIVDIDKYNKNVSTSQYNIEVVKYVLKNYKKIDSKYSFDVYYKK